MGGRHITAEEIRKAKKMRSAGCSWAEIGDKLGRSPSGLSRAMAGHEERYPAASDIEDYDPSMPGDIVIRLYGKQLRHFTMDSKELIEAMDLLDQRTR